MVISGVRCADSTRSSDVTPSCVRAVWAVATLGTSLGLPVRMATSGSAKCDLLSARCGRRRGRGSGRETRPGRGLDLGRAAGERQERRPYDEVGETGAYG